MKKRIHVRVEHAVPSRCREEFLNRRSANDAIKAEAKKNGGENMLMMPSRLRQKRTEVRAC
jgi:hypothetical protein